MDLLSLNLFEDNKTNLYQQLYHKISNQISSGEIKSGQKLPSKRTLSSQLAISVNTVDTAYQMLVAEGYLEARPKSGFFVCRLDRLEPPAKPFVTHKAEYQINPSYKFSFSTSNIDTSLFPYKTWSRIQRNILSAHCELLNHGERTGDIELRAAISNYLHEYRGVKCSAEQVVVGAGIEYLIGLLACLFHAEHFAIENPGYGQIFNILQNNNVKSSFIPVDKSGLIVDELLKTGASIVYVTPSHQFPTGVTMPISRRTELLSWASQFENRYIIEDDYDSEFRFDTKPIPALQGLDASKKVIYISTFSRIIAPSIRIAYMVLPKQVLNSFNNHFASYSSTVSRFEQHTLSRFIKDGHFARHLNRVRVAYRARRDILINELNEKLGKNNIEILGSHTGIHLLLKIKNGMTERQLVKEAMQKGVKLTELSKYYSAENKQVDFSTVLLGYSSIKEKDIHLACSLLKEAWNL